MNIVFAEPIGLTLFQKENFLQEMNRVGHTIHFYDNQPADQIDLLSRTCNADILVVSNYKVSAEVLKGSSNLKLIVVAFTGVDHIPIEECKDRGIAVCNAAGYSTQAVAELTIALAIDLLRKIIPLDGILRQNGTRNGFLGNELCGKTFGLIGFGAIGEKVALLAQAFGCNVIVWSRTVKQVKGVDFVSLDLLLKEADIVSIHIPLTDQTKGLINDSNLRLMKPTALLINTARGPIVDSSALYSALKNRIIAGAAVDVFEHEPPIENNHPLFAAPNTILLPHIGFATNEAIYDRSIIVTNNIKFWLDGKIENRVC